MDDEKTIITDINYVLNLLEVESLDYQEFIYLETTLNLNPKTTEQCKIFKAVKEILEKRIDENTCYSYDQDLFKNLLLKEQCHFSPPPCKLKNTPFLGGYSQ